MSAISNARRINAQINARRRDPVAAGYDDGLSAGHDEAWAQPDDRPVRISTEKWADPNHRANPVYREAFRRGALEGITIGRKCKHL